jgi:hypothetical protein
VSVGEPRVRGAHERGGRARLEREPGAPQPGEPPLGLVEGGVLVGHEALRALEVLQHGAVVGVGAARGLPVELEVERRRGRLADCERLRRSNFE